MDASGVVGLVQMAACCRALHGLFSEGAVKASMGHCREASNRANRSDGHLQDLRGMLVEVAAHRDAAEAARDAAEQARDAAEQERDVARGRIRELELELADAKRARR